MTVKVNPSYQFQNERETCFCFCIQESLKKFFIFPSNFICLSGSWKKEKFKLDSRKLFTGVIIANTQKLLVIYDANFATVYKKVPVWECNIRLPWRSNICDSIRGMKNLFRWPQLTSEAMPRVRRADSVFSVWTNLNWVHGFGLSQ